MMIACLGTALFIAIVWLSWPREQNHSFFTTQPGDAPSPQEGWPDPPLQPTTVGVERTQHRADDFAAQTSSHDDRRFIHARVVQSSGQPVEGAEVRVDHHGRAVDRELSAADGTCALEIPAAVTPPFIVTATHAGSSSGGVQALAEETVTLVLRPTQGYRFRVIDDETGSPVEGCTVFAFPPDRWSTYLPNRVEQRTGTDGTCVLSAPTPVLEFGFSHPDYRSREIQDPTGVAAVDSTLVIRLAPRPVLRLHIVDSQGRDVEGVSFSRFLPGWQRQAVPHETRIVEGRTEQLVAAAGPHESLQVRAAGFASAGITQGETGLAHEIVLREEAALTGRFVELRHPEEIRLTLHPHQEQSRNLPTVHGTVEPSGRFLVEGLCRETSYQVSVESPETGSATFELSVADDQQRVDWGDLDLHSILGHAPVRVTVVDESGSGIEGARVTVVRGGGVAWFSDASGLAEPNPRTTRTKLRIDRPGFLTTEIGIDDRTEIAVTLHPAPRVSGLVVDDRGAPIPCAMVRLISTATDDLHPNIPTPRTWCDASGRFSVRQALTGDCYVHVEAPGFVPAWPYPTVAEGGEIVLELQRAAQLVVELVADEVDGDWQLTASFLARGRHQVPRNERAVWVPVMPGHVRFSVEVPGQPRFDDSVEIAPGDVKRVRVSLPR